MSEHADAFHAKVKADRRSRSNPRIFYPLKGEMVFHPAWDEITSHGSAVSVLIHVLFRQPFPPNAKERKRLERAGLWPRPREEFSFPIREAKHHGMSEWALSNGLETLHRVGFIDRRHPGSGTKRGDFARYVLSERWRKWGRPDFIVLPWEKAASVGIRGDRGKFIRRRIGKQKAEDAFVAAKGTATKKHSMVETTATPPPLAAKSTVNSVLNAPFVAVESTMLLSSPFLDPDLRDGEIKKKDVDHKEGADGACTRRDDAATSPKPWRPPRSEMQENVVEILRQRPDDRADDWRFIRFIVDQLQAVQRGRLDRRRVWGDMVQQQDLDEWTTDLLFAVAVIDLPSCGEATH